MELGPIDYTSTAPPPHYRCATCGAHGCKLWREYQTFLEHQSLSCCDCAGKSQGRDVSTIDAGGRIEHVHRRTRRQRRHTARHGYRGRRGARPVTGELGRGRTDTIGWRVPAVPTEDGSTFWGYTSVPDAGCAWWRRLPTRTAEAAYQIVAAEALGLMRDVMRQP